jgi:acyl-CoA synthetase (AMP-forming)/AMP-acid ligase II
MLTSRGLIHRFLEESAARLPDKLALVDERKRLTYSQINRQSNQVAHGLIQAGVRPGDQVVLLCENSAEYVSGYYGILKSGGIAVPLNTEWKPDGLARLLDGLEPKVFLASSRLEETVRSLESVRARMGRVFLVPRRPSSPDPALPGPSGGLSFSAQPEGNPDLDIGPGSCAMIVFTSGSGGIPKGVMLSHANIVANTRAIIEYLELTLRDVQMVVLPFHYVMGKSLLNTHFAAGGAVILNNRFAYTASVLKQMAAENVTGFSGVPSTYAQLLFRSPLAKYRDSLPALRYCTQAGGHMPRPIKQDLLRILPAHTRLVIMYGATEASARLAYLPPDRLAGKLDSIGIPIAGVTMEVLSPDGRTLGPGQVGELVARGDNIMLGYYHDEEATRKVLDHRGYHTGDLGYVDEDGFFFVTGRKDEQVKIKGHRVSLRGVEDAVVESGLAMECLAFAVPDVYQSLVVAAVAVPIREAPDNAVRITDYCRAKLPDYLVPRPLLLVDAIPKTSNGKPDRAGAFDLFRSRLGLGGKSGLSGIPI